VVWSWRIDPYLDDEASSAAGAVFDPRLAAEGVGVLGHERESQTGADPVPCGAAPRSMDWPRGAGTWSGDIPCRPTTVAELLSGRFLMTSYLQRFEQTPADRRWPLVRRWMFEEPLPFFAELRAHRPILAMPEVTLATRFSDCETILRRYDAFSVALYRAKQGDYWMAQDDTPVHWREKSIMRAVLDREQIPEVRAFVASRAAAILKDAGGAIDAVNALTRAVPLALVEEWFGFVDGDPRDLFEWSYWNQYDAFWNQPFDAVVVPDPSAIVAKRQAANERMRGYIVALVRRRIDELKAGQNNTDLVSRLVRLSLSGALQFDVPRVVLNVGGLLIGAVETTSHAAINALAGLLNRPEVLDEARVAAAADDPAAFDGYVFEALRFKPAFPYFFRVCEQPTVLAGGTDYATAIRPGTTMLALTHSAMFDSAVFPDPDRFDPTRPYGNTFHFGQGLHECLGRPIARVMLPEIVRQCLRLPGLAAAGPVEYQGGPVPESYPLRWNA
jgi:cytochrome P450